MSKLIVIDGLDGSGKATQAELLYNKLKIMGKNVHRVSFPNYADESSSAVKVYLSGALGEDASKLNPYMCSQFYAVDRAIQYVKHLKAIHDEEDAILICDRYLSANIIHQGAKIESAEDKKKFFEWVYDNEVNKMGIPSDDLTIILSVPVELSQKLMANRYNNDESKKDIHEANIGYLKTCYNTVDLAVSHLKNCGYNWVKIDCSTQDGESIKSIEEIERLIWDKVLGVL